MRFRNARLRTKVTALLVSLTALWAFAAWVTLREGVNLLGASALDSGYAQPSDPLLAELQQERRLSVTWLADPRAQTRAALDAQRLRTDAVRTEFERAAQGGAIRRAANTALEQRIDESLELVRGIESNRQAIDSRLADRERAATPYSEMIESIFRSYELMAALDDKELARDTRTLVELNRMWEKLAQEDTLLAGALTTGRLTSTEHAEFVQAVGVRRYNTLHAAVGLQVSDAAVYEDLTTSQAIRRVQNLEDQLIQRGGTARPGVTAEQWRQAAQPALAEMRQVIQSAGDRLVARATPGAIWTVVRLLLAGGLGLLAVIASIVVSITTARALVKQLERLRDAALELSDRRLPSVVERLGHGEQVNVAAEAPPLEFGNDEIGQVGQAFNTVQETAIRTAVEQAELRRGIRDILLSLARRTQTLVRRQLTILDVMERRELDPTELEDLFRIDHLATRMRRNAENLIVLSGATPARGWRRSVAMVDVLRAAVAEVEDYSRVNVLPTGQVALVGRAVGDVTHLLAELIENAVTFSPSYTTVEVGGRMAASGYAVEIEDRGLGMAEENLAAANEQIASSPEFNLSSTARLGLYVVSRLAGRYGIRVSLKHSAYGGTTAVVLIPRELVVDQVDAIDATPEPQGDRSDASLVGAGVTAGRRNDGTQAAAHGVALVEAVTGPGGAAPGGVGPDGPPAAGPPTLRTVPPRRTDPELGVVGGNRNGPARLPVEENVQPEESMTTPEASRTPSGLPVRVPQANLAPALRADTPPTGRAAEEEDDAGRSPEEIRRSLGSYQSGTQRGRFDAAQTRPGTEQTPPSATDDE
jgi:nitrate/nitrite sensing protein/histidine kinase/DNA gyrase B/HSP90-like ATPase/HAMP domain-containing protein